MKLKLKRRWLLIAVLCTLCAGVPLIGITVDCWWYWNDTLQAWVYECGSGDVSGACVGSYTGCEEDAADVLFNDGSACISMHSDNPDALLYCLGEAQDDYDQAIEDCLGC